MDYNKFTEIQTFMLDVDGVLTNSDLLITESGELLRKMSVKDGQAIKTAIQAGYQFLVITKGNSQGVKKRLQGLGIQLVFDGVEDKMTVLNELISNNTIQLEHCAYMGDDLPDIPILKRVLLPCCPKDAIPEVKAHSEFISSKEGGKQCVRELIEKVMKAQNQWPQA